MTLTASVEAGFSDGIGSIQGAGMKQEREPRAHDLVMISADSLNCVCPQHGEQPGAEYAPGTAPCGCSWEYGDDGLLHAIARECAGDVAESA